MQIKLRGRVQIVIGKTRIAKTNDVSSDFAIALGKTVLSGTLGGYGYGSGFALPTQVVIVLLNNNAVVTTISTNITKFNDQITTNGELTSVTFVGSDATPVQYTFNQLELYTVVQNTLYLKIATVTLQNPLTKNINDIVNVTWTEEIISSSSLINFTNTQQACSQCSTTCNTSTLSQASNTASVVNLVWALLIIPNANTIVSQISTPLSSYITQVYTYYLANNKLPNILGITNIILTDQCLNVIENASIVSPIITYGLTGTEAIVSLAVFITPAQSVYYALPVFTIQGVLSAFLGIVQVQNPSQVTAGQISIILQIPYGSSTLQALNINE
ncbi:hypothetical protein SBFV1_gp49 [Sulfolobales Beppu filamentous phage 1]|uniref:Uncharacterized protein n=1 Tax=Sulfolobales Beppu filamentous phage 1 TaxID=2493122 RepID=A0A3S8NEU4_9VIRU|nr:hypothetical protein SBFV1_gp49 [Sulfolobales Beppu filamentous phage 1]